MDIRSVCRLAPTTGQRSLAIRVSVGVDILGHAHRGPGLGPACVERGMGEDFGHLFGSDATGLGPFDMALQSGGEYAAGHYRRHCHDAAIPRGKLVLAGPDLPEQDVVVALPISSVFIVGSLIDSPARRAVSPEERFILGADASPSRNGAVRDHWGHNEPWHAAERVRHLPHGSLWF